MTTTDIIYWSDLPRDFTGIIRYWTGSKYWFHNGELHREDGSAIEYFAGYAEYYVHGRKTYQTEMIACH